MRPGLAVMVILATLGGCQRGQGQSAAAEARHVSSVGEMIPASSLPGEEDKGYLVFARWCAGCHAPARAGHDQEPVPARIPLGTNLLQQKYQGKIPAALEARTDLTPETINYFVRHGVNAMPGFRKTEIPDADLAALSAYLTRKR